MLLLSWLKRNATLAFLIGVLIAKLNQFKNWVKIVWKERLKKLA
jgi:hypothetical protein